MTLNDLGCGYGALLAHLDARHAGCLVDYLGIDLTPSMVRRARRLWRGRPGARFVAGHESPRLADYSVASGIFNVALGQPVGLWECFIGATLNHLFATSARGFAVNFVAGEGPGQVSCRGLYSTTPARWAGYCATMVRAEVDVVQDYGMREFSLLVRRSAGETG